MPDGTNDQNNLATQSFSGAAEQSKQYKTYVKRLKKGKSSGISHILGSAAELLPNENLKEYLHGNKPYELGEKLLKKGADPAVVQRAIEEMLAIIANNANSSMPTDPTGAGREVIGVYIENGKKMLLFADLSVMQALT